MSEPITPGAVDIQGNIRSHCTKDWPTDVRMMIMIVLLVVDVVVVGAAAAGDDDDGTPAVLPPPDTRYALSAAAIDSVAA